MTEKTIDKSPVYLLFGTHINGHTELLSVDTELWISRAHRAGMEWVADRYIRIWVEKRERNHLYGASMDTTLRSAVEAIDADIQTRVLTGDDSLTKEESSILSDARQEIGRLRGELELSKLRAGGDASRVVLSPNDARGLANIARGWLHRAPRDYDNRAIVEAAIRVVDLQIAALKEGEDA
jgi:hypothetical protein